MIRISLDFKSKRTKIIEVFFQGTNDSQNSRCETMYIADYECVCISNFVVLKIKRWLEEDVDLNTDHPLYLFKFVQLKAQN